MSIDVARAPSLVGAVLALLLPLRAPIPMAASAAAAAAFAQERHEPDEASIRSALLRDKDLDSANIQVTVDARSRIVTLRGSVTGSEPRFRAESIVRKAAPGYRVDNQLTVR